MKEPTFEKMSEFHKTKLIHQGFPRNGHNEYLLWDTLEKTYCQVPTMPSKKTKSQNAGASDPTVLLLPTDSTPASSLLKFVGKRLTRGNLFVDAIYDKDINDRFGNRKRKRTIRFKIPPGADPVKIEWEGKPVRIWRTAEDQVVGCGSSGPKKFDVTHVESNELDKAALKRLIVKSFEVNEAQSTKKMVSLKIFNGSYWEPRGLLSKRSSDSLFLPEKDTDELFQNLETFIDEKDQYHRFQIPYKKVILLEGLPGSGKTSLAFVVASHFERDLYVLPLTHETDDHSLNNALSSIGSGSVLVLEDIDCIFQDDMSVLTKPKVTLSGITNVLDGLSRIDNLWIFLTSNDKSVLPPVLLRQGRVDHHLHFGHIALAEIQKMVRAFFQEGETEDVELLATQLFGVAKAKKLSASACVFFLFEHRKKEPHEILDCLKDLDTEETRHDINSHIYGWGKGMKRANKNLKKNKCTREIPDFQIILSSHKETHPGKNLQTGNRRENESQTLT